MKSRIIVLSLSAGLIPLGSPAGQEDSVAAMPELVKGGLVKTPPVPPRRGLRLGLGFAPLLGVDVDFSGLGTYNNPLVPQPLGGGQNYNYDDGFVRVDATGNARGQTWNWGYENAGQHDPSAPGTMSYNISNSLANGSASESDDVAPGVEIVAYYALGDVPTLSFGGGSASWGLKATIHYAHIDVEHSGAVLSGINRVTDTFGTNRIVPPAAPYSGSFVGPGPAILDSPARASTDIAGGATVGGQRELDVNLLGLTVGPYLEIPIGPRASVSAEAGFSIAVADGDYNFTSITTIPAVGTQTTTGTGDESALLPGAAVGLTGIYQVNDSWSVYGSARYQTYSSLEIDAGTSEAEVDFGGAFILSAGAIIGF